MVMLRRSGTKFENNYFKEMCSASEAGSYLRLTDFVYHSTLSLRVIKKKKKPRARFALRSKVDGFVPHTQRVN